MAQSDAPSLAGLAVSPSTSADLLLNWALTPVGSTLALDLTSTSVVVPNWSGAPLHLDLEASDASQALTLVAAEPDLDLHLMGGLALGENILTGNLTATLEQVNGLRRWTLTVSDAQLTLGSGDVSASLEGASGQLILGSDGSRSGSLQGTILLSGVEGVSLSGQVDASFDSAGTLQVAGALNLSVDGVGSLAGNFSFASLPALLALPRQELVNAATGAHAVVLPLTQGGVRTGASYRLLLGGGDGLTSREGTYRFTVGSETASVSSLQSNGQPLSDVLFAAALKTELEQLAAVGAGTLTVSGSRAEGFTLSFGGNLLGKALSLTLQAPALPAQERWALADLLSPAASAADAVQDLRLTAPLAGGGSFTLSLATGSTGTVTMQLRYFYI
jgi:hypothetical protein